MRPFIVVVGLLSVLGASCSLKRDNPYDRENQDVVQITVQTTDGLSWDTDSLVIKYSVIGAADSIKWRLIGNTIAGDSQWNVANPSQDSLVISDLDEGSYQIEIQGINENGESHSDTISAKINAVQGPALLLVPQRVRPVSKGDSFDLQVYVDEVSRLIGFHSVLSWDTTLIKWEGYRANWNVFADRVDAGLELSAVSLDSSLGFSGSGYLITLSFSAKADIKDESLIWLDSLTQFHANSGMKIPVSKTRGSVIQ